MVRTSFKRLLLFMLIGLGFTICDVYASSDWSYIGNTGPIRWGQLDPAFALCASGKLQSPINIGKTFKAVDYALSVNYQPATMDIVNDGETELTIGAAQIIHKEHAIKLSFQELAQKETINFKGKDYRLVEFHFH